MRQLKIQRKITNRESASLEKYFLDINKVDMITPEVEVQLAKRIQQGDQGACEKLVRANLRFVVSVAKQYQNQMLSLNDLINEGNLGLVKAAKKFDPSKGFKFITYAVWWIRQSIMQARAESRIVRLPLNKVGAISKVTRAISDLEQRLERIPTEEELAQLLDIEEKDIMSTMSSNTRHVSVDAPLNEGESSSLLDVIESDETECPDHYMVHNYSLSVETERTLSQLDERDKQVVKMFFGIGTEHPMSLQSIGEELGLTCERVRQIKEKSIQILRSSTKKQLLVQYLG